MPRKSIKKKVEERLAELRTRSRNDDRAITHAVEDNFAAVARIVFTLTDEDEGIRKAFEFSGLNSRNPYHFKLLLRILADAHFQSSRPRRSSRRWTPARWARLLGDYHTIKQRYPRESIRRICQRLKRERPAEYGRLSGETLRRQLRNAANASMPFRPRGRYRRAGRGKRPNIFLHLALDILSDDWPSARKFRARKRIPAK
jgi:hypothetical protein